MSDYGQPGAYDPADVGVRAVPTVEVQILELPLPVWERSQEHVDGLLREFALLVSGQSGTPSSTVPHQLLELVEELQADYEGMTTAQEESIVAAAEAGESSIDLVYHVPDQVAEACTRLDAALDEADRYCREGEYLLSLATPPEALAFRRWFLTQFVDQIAGQPPQAWPHWQDAHRN